MATRSTIVVEGIDYCKIYKHWDGYPDGMLDWLKDFNEQFTKKRGDDPSYKIAQLLRFAYANAGEYNLDDSLFTGWGIIEMNDRCGAEYEYVLHKDGKVTFEEIEY